MSDRLPWILGIASSHNGGACLLHGADIVVAIQEERLLRLKRAEHPGAFPSASITYCLGHAGIHASQLDAVALCATASNKERREDIHLNPQLQVVTNRVPVFTVPHHFGHAVAVHALSGMPSAGVLIVDGGGSPWDEMLEEERAVIVPGQLEAVSKEGHIVPREHLSLYVANRGVITPIEKHVASYPINPSNVYGLQEFRSLGDMYGFAGARIFGSFLEGPGKVMGLAPYGQPTIPVDDFYRITPLGFEFQDQLGSRFEQGPLWPNRQEEYRDLAASVQRALEEALLLICRRLRAVHEDLCYAGGVALNSVANERIVRESGFRDVFIMPAAEDSGTAIGAAYYGLWQLCGYSPRERQRLDNVGRSYREEEVAAAVAGFPGLRIRKADIVDETADLLSRGKIVGWFHDGSELGPRALGQRSILCDPRPADMKDVLNQRVKFREGFRPFAPVILEEEMREWFEVDGAHPSSPFMLRVMPFRREQAARVPAVVHVDGTGRVQTVSKEASPRLYRLLTAFKERTGIPLLLNTSFNIAGEPIVETPAEAMWCFLYTDMDYCVVGDYILSKADAVDGVLDFPLAVTTGLCFLCGDPSANAFPIQPLCDTEEQAISAHVGRMEDVPLAALTFNWLRLIVVVPATWGAAVHGLPSGFLHILRSIDGRRTGREIYACLMADGRCVGEPNTRKVAEEYSLTRFRRHLGLLKRIGAIGFTTATA